MDQTIQILNLLKSPNFKKEYKNPMLQGCKKKRITRILNLFKLSIDQKIQILSLSKSPNFKQEYKNSILQNSKKGLQES